MELRFPSFLLSFFPPATALALPVVIPVLVSSKLARDALEKRFKLFRRPLLAFSLAVGAIASYQGSRVYQRQFCKSSSFGLIPGGDHMRNTSIKAHSARRDKLSSNGTKQCLNRSLEECE